MRACPTHLAGIIGLREGTFGELERSGERTLVAQRSNPRCTGREPARCCIPRAILSASPVRAGELQTLGVFVNAIETAVQETLKEELVHGEAPLSSIAWELQETHGLQESSAVRASALTIVASLLTDPNIGIYELKGDFVPWGTAGAAALRRLVDTRTRDDVGAPLRTFGWADHPQLFFLRHSVREAYNENRRSQKRWWQFWVRDT